MLVGPKGTFSGRPEEGRMEAETEPVPVVLRHPSKLGTIRAGVSPEL